MVSCCLPQQTPAQKTGGARRSVDGGWMPALPDGIHASPLPSFRGAPLREPGIHNHQSGLWIPGLRFQSAIADWKVHPGMTRRKYERIPQSDLCAFDSLSTGGAVGRTSAKAIWIMPAASPSATPMRQAMV
jgi:hypothetical protein